jgi:hypothetical protein
MNVSIFLPTTEKRISTDVEWIRCPVTRCTLWTKIQFIALSRDGSFLLGFKELSRRPANLVREAKCNGFHSFIKVESS